MCQYLFQFALRGEMDWSPEGSILYFVDTPTRMIARFKFNESDSTIVGKLAPIDLMAYSGSPDGRCVDIDGNLWVAFRGGGAVRKLRPLGSFWMK